MIYTVLTKKAMKLCFTAHKDQVDKSGLPYVLHPFHLAEEMTDELTTVAALLHDVVEDTDYTLDDLRQMGFPEEVLDALALLTHDDGTPYLDYVARLKDNPIARAVKLADLRHNSDLTRLDSVDERALARIKKYSNAIALLEQSVENTLQTQARMKGFAVMQDLADAIKALNVVRGNVAGAASDAIVCPDNEGLTGSGGAAAAIHKAAGPELRKATAALGGCGVGEVKVTEGYQLNAKYVIHTVGPIWRGGSKYEETMLAKCYAKAMDVAVEKGCRTITFASISTGAYQFPLERAAEIAVRTIIHRLMTCDQRRRPQQVDILCYDDMTLRAFQLAAKREVVERFLENYTPEACICNGVSAFDMTLYFNCMIKLKDLENGTFNYNNYMGVFMDVEAKGLGEDERYHLLAKKCGDWDYLTCLAYITVLQREAYWSGGYSAPHVAQCGMGGVRLVLMRMKQLLSAERAV